MHVMNKKIFLLFVLLTFTPTVVHAKNVILLIGDGMGTSIITGTRYYRDDTGKTKLFMDTLPLIAHVITRSYNHMVTDSAAASTAMATGVRTINNCIGYSNNCDSETKAENIAELTTKHEISSGLVTTTRITHATPAAFYSRISDRDNESEIAKQLLSSGVDIALGGGQKFFDIETAKASGFKYVTTQEELDEIMIGEKILGCFAESHIPYVTERQKTGYSGPSLSEMSLAAIKKLTENPNGYFLMIEGGRIDHAAHDNRAKEVFEETLEFDRTIKQVLETVDLNETVVFVTADHDTGGMSLNGYPLLGSGVFGSGGEDESGKLYPILTWSTGPISQFKSIDPFDSKSEASHTAIDVPLYAAGKLKNNISGTIDNTEIFNIIKDNLLDDKQ